MVSGAGWVVMVGATTDPPELELLDEDEELELDEEDELLELDELELLEELLELEDDDDEPLKIVSYRALAGSV